MNQVRKSITALKQFEFCERQFYYQRILKLPEKPSIHLALGILYHNCLERIALGKELTNAAILNLIAEAAASPLWVEPQITLDELAAEIQFNLRRVQQQVLPHLCVQTAEVWGTHYCAKVDIVAGNTPVVEDGKIIDVLKGERCIVDWKTVSKLRSRSQYEVDQSGQLALYCLEFDAAAGAIIEIPRNPNQDLNVIVTRFDIYDLNRWRNFFDAQFAAMNSRGTNEAEYKLATRGHGLCSPKWCTHWDQCPGGK